MGLGSEHDDTLCSIVASERTKKRKMPDGRTDGCTSTSYFISLLFFFIFAPFFSDPDLKIEVDLAREEEEKNGRREYRIYHLQYRYAGKYVG